MKQTIKKESILLEDLGMKYPKETSKEKRRYGLYKCHCGKEFEAQVSNVKYGNKKSCGCSKIIHGRTNHRLYNTWKDMIRRCNNPKRKDYKDYGLRGIAVCNEWLDINNFISDMYPSYKEGLTLDRINPNGNYEKSNCRWANKTVQARNTQRLRKDNMSGYRGVSWHKKQQKFNSRITVNSITISLGLSKTAIEAAKAYDKYIIDNNLEHTLNGVIL